MNRRAQRRSRVWVDFDWWLLLAALGLAGLGVVEIHSAQPGQDFWMRQLAWIGLGLVGMIGLALIDYRRLAEMAWMWYAGAIGLLILVLIAGTEVNGARAWFRIGGVSIQPSEFAKLASVLALALYLTKAQEERRGRIDPYLTMGQLTRATALILVPMILIVLEPDQGTAITYLPALAGAVFVAGIRPRWVITGSLLLVLVMAAGWQGRRYFLKPYQLQRIEAILHPERVDPWGFGYHTMQSNIAVGSGGLWGKGIAQGTQSRLKFLPYPHTDFIASVVAEETGFVGMVIVLGLYLFILMRAIDHARRARDQLGTILTAGLVCLLGFHIIVNIGMVVGLLPIMGIPLPLMSYGGSSMMTTFMALGLIASVRFHRYVN